MDEKMCYRRKCNYERIEVDDNGKKRKNVEF